MLQGHQARGGAHARSSRPRRSRRLRRGDARSTSRFERALTGAPGRAPERSSTRDTRSSSASDPDHRSRVGAWTNSARGHRRQTTRGSGRPRRHGYRLPHPPRPDGHHRPYAWCRSWPYARRRDAMGPAGGSTCPEARADGGTWAGQTIPGRRRHDPSVRPSLTVRRPPVMPAGGSVDPLRVVPEADDHARVQPCYSTSGDLGDDATDRLQGILRSWSRAVWPVSSTRPVIDRYVITAALFGGDDARGLFRRSSTGHLRGPPPDLRRRRGASAPICTPGDGPLPRKRFSAGQRRSRYRGEVRDRGGLGWSTPSTGRGCGSGPRPCSTTSPWKASTAVNGVCLTVVAWGDGWGADVGGGYLRPQRPRLARPPETRSTSNDRCVSRTAWAGTWSGVTSMRSGRVVAPAPDLAVQVPAGPGALPGRRGPSPSAASA